MFVWLFAPAFAFSSLAAASPWLLSFCFYFGVTLRIVGRFDRFSRRVLNDLPPSARNRMRAWSQSQHDRYRLWCIVFVAKSVLLLLLGALWPESVWVQQMVLMACVGAAMACVYAPWYHDCSELTGQRASARFRAWSLWDVWAAYFGLTPLYMHTPPDGLPQRDERRVHLKRHGVPPVAVDVDTNLTDQHAMMRAYHEPWSIFTRSRLEYERAIHHRGPLARRPRIYAMHPHGLSTITSVFGAAFYGSEPMLPDADNVRIAVADLIFTLPVIREFALAAGCVSASRAAMHFNLRGGRDILALPGGTLEQAFSVYGQMDLVWTRHGFCGMAYEHGASLVPIVAFGETDAHVTFDVLRGWRRQNYERFRYAFPFVFAGPFPANLTPVVGVPIGAAVTRMTDAERSRVERWLIRHRDCLYPQPRWARSVDDATVDESSAGDTPLTDLGSVSRSLQLEENVDPDQPRSDYYGEGYEREDDDFLRRTSWYVFREDEHKEGGGFTTIIDTALDNDSLLRSGHRLGLQRAFYAQWLDLYHLGRLALCNHEAPLSGASLSAEEPGESLHQLAARLHRSNPARQFWS